MYQDFKIHTLCRNPGLIVHCRRGSFNFYALDCLRVIMDKRGAGKGKPLLSRPDYRQRTFRLNTGTAGQLERQGKRPVVAGNRRMDLDCPDITAASGRKGNAGTVVKRKRKRGIVRRNFRYLEFNSGVSGRIRQNRRVFVKKKVYAVRGSLHRQYRNGYAGSIGLLTCGNNQIADCP